MGESVPTWLEAGKSIPENLDKSTVTQVLPEKTRNLYVIHAGFFSGKDNCAANDIRRGLLERGLPEKDVIVLPSDFPAADFNCTCPPPEEAAQAGLMQRTLDSARKCLNIGHNLLRNIGLYIQYADPDSPESRLAYQRMKETLHLAPGEKANITYIGYSGGGQLGLTMAKLAEQESRIKMTEVVTMGSPIMQNNAPQHVAVRSYVSSGDTILNKTSALPLVHFTPPSLDQNDAIRSFGRNINHFRWYNNDQVLDKLYQDVTTNDKAVTSEPLDSKTVTALSLPMPTVDFPSNNPALPIGRAHNPLQRPTLQHIAI